MLRRPGPTLLLALLLTLTGLAGGGPVTTRPAHAAEAGIHRLPAVDRAAGPDRYTTAALLAAQTHPDGAATVVVTAATVGDPSNPSVGGLLAGPYAAQIGAAVLLTGPDSLPAATRQAIIDLAPDQVVAVGADGPAGMTGPVLEALADLGPVVRTHTDPDPTAAAIDLAAQTRRAGAGGPALVARLTSWPDVLVAATTAAALDGIVLPAVTEPTDRWYDLAGDDVVIVGGRAAVPGDVEDDLARRSVATARVGGATRQHTAAAAAELVTVRRDDIDTVWLARADQPADVLAAVPSVARAGVMLLIPPHDEPADPDSPAGHVLLPQVLAGAGQPCEADPERWCGHTVGVPAAGWIRMFAARTARPLTGRVMGGPAAITATVDTQLAFLLDTGAASGRADRSTGPCVALSASPDQPGAWQAEVDRHPAGTCFTVPAGVAHRQQITPRTGDRYIGQPGAIMDGATPLDGPWHHQVVAGRDVWTHQRPVDQTWVEASQCARPDRFPGRTCHTQDVFAIEAGHTSRFLRHAGTGADRTLQEALASAAQGADGDYVIVRSHPTDPAADAATVHLLIDPDDVGPLVVSTTATAFQGEQRTGGGWDDIDDVTIVGVEIRHYASHFQRGAINGKFADGWLVEDVHAHHNHAVGISLGRSGAARNITATDNGQLGFSAAGTAGGVVGTARIQLHGAELTGNNVLGVDPGWEAGAMKITGGVRGVDVTDTTIVDNDGYGLWLDIDNANAHLVGNTVDNPLAGIFYEISHGPALIAGNRVTQRSDRSVFISTSNGVLVTDNTLPGCRDTGRAVLVEDGRRRGQQADELTIVGPHGPLEWWGGAVDVRNHIDVGIAPDGWDNRPGFTVEDGPDSLADPAAARVLFEGNRWRANPAGRFLYANQMAGRQIPFDRWQSLGMDTGGASRPC